MLKVGYTNISKPVKIYIGCDTIMAWMLLSCELAVFGSENSKDTEDNFN